MALFPQGFTQIDRQCNPGERRVLHQLRRCLGDEHCVWHNVPVGPRGRRPDFVILSPRQGLLVLEVKDWKLGTLRSANRDSVELLTERGLVTQANPLRQARDYGMELATALQADPALVRQDELFHGKLLFPYGWGVVFSHLHPMEVAGTEFSEIFPTAFTLMRDDLDEAVDEPHFQQRLWGMFTVSFPHTLTPEQRERVRWHLFPELRMPIQLPLALEGRQAPALPEKPAVMDLEQEQVARRLGDGHRVIHGVAGSGKTMILIHRAEQLAAAAGPDETILVLCYNRALAGRMDSLLRQRGIGHGVQVRTFHGWCQELVNRVKLDIQRKHFGSDDAYYTAMVAMVDQAMESGFVASGQYSAVLVDEAHDFEASWLRIAARLVEPEHQRLLVLYDDVQAIYQRERGGREGSLGRQRFSLSSVGIQALGRTRVLKLNYRNTAEVLALATECAQGLLTVGEDRMAEDSPLPWPPTSAGRHGPWPVLQVASDEADEARWVARHLLGLHQRGVAWGDMAVLARVKRLLAPLEAELGAAGVPFQSQNRQRIHEFDWQADSVRLLSLHSAKGLEFAQVVILGLQVMPQREETLEEATRLLYVAMTRATGQLALTAARACPLAEGIAKTLEKLSASAAAQPA